MCYKICESGKNACYMFTSKKIVMQENKLGLAVFHEAGHAYLLQVLKYKIVNFNIVTKTDIIIIV